MSEVQSYEKLFIGGQWQTSSGEDFIEVISPTTQEVIATVPSASTKDVDRAVAAARRAFDEGALAPDDARGARHGDLPHPHRVREATPRPERDLHRRDRRPHPHQ